MSTVASELYCGKNAQCSKKSYIAVGHIQTSDTKKMKKKIIFTQTASSIARELIAVATF